MSSYEMLSVCISAISVLIALSVAFVTYIPYFNKIKFKVTLNPYIKGEDYFNIRILIINKSSKDLDISDFYVVKGLKIHTFKKTEFPSKVKANSSVDWVVKSTDLTFETDLSFGHLKDKPRYIAFRFIDSVKKVKERHVRIIDFDNADKLTKLWKKVQAHHASGEKDVSPESMPRFLDKADLIVKNLNKSK